MLVLMQRNNLLFLRSFLSCVMTSAQSMTIRHIIITQPLHYRPIVRHISRLDHRLHFTPRYGPSLGERMINVALRQTSECYLYLFIAAFHANACWPAG